MNDFYTGVVEDRISDPMKLGRCKVRIFGIHTEDKVALPTEDLPWAIVMQPVTSAAMSGIGHAPVGPVEGSWVVVIFSDVDQQQPIIIGTLGGVPQKDESKTAYVKNEDSVLVDGSGNPVTDGSGNPITTPNSTPAATTEPPAVNKPTALSLSAEGLKELKSHEGLASLDQAKRRIGSDKTPNDATIYAYKDTKGIWTIGWGSIYMPDGSKVNETSRITKAEADKLLADRLAKEFEPAVKRNVKVTITQSMYDALVSLAYNMGVSGLFKTEIASALNSGKYEEAAAFIPLTKTNGGTLSNRRAKEQSLFIKDGYPTTEGEVKPSAVSEETAAPQTDLTQNPVVIKRSAGSLSATQSLNPRDEEGFKDPNKYYPKWLNEPDTHRLARHESIANTIVFSKEAARVRSVKTASGGTWNQPPIPYNAAYPYNHIFASESGHVQEFDDTPGNERVQTYHRSGTYEEIDKNGTRVTRIVGDDFEILERNGNVLIKGSCNVTIQGNSNVRVENNSTIQVLGNAHMSVTGNMTTAVGGNYQINVAGEFQVDASKVYWNSQKATGVSLPTEGATGVPSFGELTTPSRAADIDANYETPEEGNSEDFVNEQIKRGNVDPADIVTPTEKKEETVAPEKAPAPISNVCEKDIWDAKSFTAGFKLTSTLSLGDMCKGDSGIPSGTNYGMTANEIVCNLKLLAINVIEPIRKKYPNMIMSSTWRSEAVNTRVGGKKTSDHLKGMAADIQFSGFTREQYYQAAIDIQKFLPAYRQIILEYKGDKTWIHVSYNSNQNKMETLTMDAAKNKTLASGKFVLV